MGAVGTHAEVSVGTHHQQCDVLDAEKVGIDRLKMTDVFRQMMVSCEGEKRREQRRIGDEFLQGSEEVRQHRSLGDLTAEKNKGVAGAMSQFMKSAARCIRRFYRDGVG